MTSLTGLSYFLVGPSSILNFPDSLLLIGIGSALLGFFIAGMLIPALPEMIDVLPLYTSNVSSKLREDSIAFYSQMIGIGLLFGPMYGASMT